MRIFCLFFVAMLASCGIIQDRSSDYVKANPGKEIILPEGLTDASIQSQYPIPEISNKRSLAKEYELPKPPNATAALDEAPFTIEQVNENVWLRLYQAPGKVWPLLDAFWQEYEISPAEEFISDGFVVTDIISDATKLETALNAGAAENLFKIEQNFIQASLVQGIRRNTSEIKVRILESQDGSVIKQWQNTSINLERDKRLLTLIGEYITSDALQNRYSMLANNIGGQSRIQLLQDDSGDNYLLLNLSFQRAWNELSKAMESAKIIVSDKDLGQKTYYVSYINASDIESWYVSDEKIAAKKLERNFALTFNEAENSAFKLKVALLNDDLDPKLKNDLIDLIFEHIN